MIRAPTPEADVHVHPEASRSQADVLLAAEWNSDAQIANPLTVCTGLEVGGRRPKQTTNNACSGISDWCHLIQDTAAGIGALGVAGR